jgi:hypothetical protein
MKIILNNTEQNITISDHRIILFFKFLWISLSSLIFGNVKIRLKFSELTITNDTELNDTIILKDMIVSKPKTNRIPPKPTPPPNQLIREGEDMNQRIHTKFEEGTQSKGGINLKPKTRTTSTKRTRIKI